MSDAEKDVQEFKEIVKKQAEHLIMKLMPEKIVRLNELIATSVNADITDVYQDLNISTNPLTISDLQSSKQRPRMLPSRNGHGRKHSRLSTASTSRGDNMQLVPSLSFALVPNGTVPCNQHLNNLIRLVKPHIIELLEDTNLLKMWIYFMIPKYEDSNNLGVAIQKMILTSIQMIEEFANSLFGHTSTCFITRADIVSKVSTFPHINDYRRAVRETDEDNYRYLCKNLSQIRDFYCSLHDVVTKNFEKIKNPRTCQTNSMCI